MRTPTISDEELTAAAEALHAEGQLSIRRLRARVGGGDTGRLSRVARGVREEASPATDTTPEGKGEKAPSVEPELPKPVLGDLDRLRSTVLRELHQVRQQEVDRARAAEAALTAGHGEEVRKLVDDMALLREDMSDLESAVEEHLDQIARLEAAEAEVRAALARSEDERRSAAEAHTVDRRTLGETAARLEEERAEEADGRRRAEAALEESRTRNANLTTELQREREETARLRALLKTEVERRAELDSKYAAAVEAAEKSTARLAEAEAARRAAEVESAELRGRVQAHDGLVGRLETALGGAKKPATRSRQKKS